MGSNARHGWVTIVEKEIPKTSGGKQRLTFNPGSGRFEDKKVFEKAIKAEKQLPISERGLNLDADPVNLSHMPVEVTQKIKGFLYQKTLAQYPI